MRTFNPLAEHGQVFPSERGAVFYQDGGYFNASGELVWEDHPPTMKTVETEETVVETVVDTSGKAKSTIKTVKVKSEVQVETAAEPKVALAAWLRGEVTLNHLTVVSLVKEGFGMVIRKKDDIIDYLVNDASLVPAEQVRVKLAGK